MESIFSYFKCQEVDHLKPGDKKLRKSNSKARAVCYSSSTTDGLNETHPRGNKRIKATHSNENAAIKPGLSDQDKIIKKSSRDPQKLNDINPGPSCSYV